MNSPVHDKPLTLAVTPRALFDLRPLATAPQLARPLQAGAIFPLVRKLLALNSQQQQLVDVVLLSNEAAQHNLAILQAVRHHGLPIERAAMSREASSHHYAAALGADLFLSTDSSEVRLALAHGVAAATVTEQGARTSDDDIIRIAFDGDAVLFSDEAERVYASAGLAAFNHSEQQAVHQPLPRGPLQPLLLQLQRLQALYHGAPSPIRTALVTARGIAAHERALRTLQSWHVDVDDAMFLAGTDKGPALRQFGADIFFDDQVRNCERAALHVACAHVPYGTKNHPASTASQPRA